MSNAYYAELGFSSSWALVLSVPYGCYECRSFALRQSWLQK
jgi:hypothetical protein